MRKKRQDLLVSLAVSFLITLLFSGCGGGGGGGKSQTPPATTTYTYTLTGEVYDELLDGATVSFYLTDPNHPIAQTVTNSSGTYQAQVTVNAGTQIIYTRACGGRLATSGEEFSGRLYGVAPLTGAAGGTTLQVHLNPITSLLRHYLTETSGATLDNALGLLAGKLKEIDPNAPDSISQSDLARLSRSNALVRRISNLISYQVDQADPNSRSIDRVISRIAGGWLPDEGKLRQALKLAEAAAANGKGELTGRVVDFDTQNPLQGATVRVRGTSFQSQTDTDGNFFFRQLPAGMSLIVEVEASGYASTQEIVEISSHEKSQNILISLKAVAARAALDLEQGIIASHYRARARSLRDGGLQISTLDNSMSLTFPAEALGRMRRHLSQQQARYSGGAENQNQIVYVNMTPIDPTREIEAFPGDFTTSDPNAEGVLAAREKKLESVVLGEFSLVDESGRPITDLDLGEGVEIRFRLPEALQEMYRQKYDQGERTIPWYAYDPNDGIWKRSDQPSRLILVDDVLYAVAVANHFSWWNVDWPVETHGCIEGYVRQDGQPLAGVQIEASGIDYQGQSFAMTDQSGHYQVTVKRGAWSRITARFGGYEIKDPNPVYVSRQKSEGCEQKDINFNLVDICGRVVNQNNQGIRGAYVYVDTGIGKFTDSNGDFHLISDPNRSLKLKVSYTHNQINYHVTKDVAVGSEDLCGDRKIIIPLDLSPQYVRGFIKIIENNATKPLLGKEVKISADNGFTTSNDSQGFYEVAAERGTSNLKILYRYYASNGSYLEQSRSFSWSESGALQGDPNVTFELHPAWIWGMVADKTTGEPIPNVRISTTLGTYTLSDPNTGEYELEVPANTSFKAIARLAIPAAAVVEEDCQQINPLGFGERKQVNFTLDSRVAKIRGQVIDSQGNPLPYVSVISEYKARTMTDSNGNFTLIVPANIKVKLAFTCEGYTPEIREFPTPDRGVTKDIGQVVLSKPNFRPVIQKVDVQPGLRVCWGGDPNSTVITLKITAMDINGDPLTYQVITPNGTPAATLIADPNCFSWKAPALGQYSLTVQVSDGKENGTATVRLPIEVVNCVENRAPVIISLSPDKPVIGTVGQTKSFGVVAYDPDGDKLTYQWQILDQNQQVLDHNVWSLSAPSGKNTNLTIPAGLFNDRDPNQPARFTVRVTVSDVRGDGKGKSVTKGVSLTVWANLPPQIRTIMVEPNHCILGDTVKLLAEATDPDGDYPLVYSWSCRGVSIGSGSNINWTIPDDPNYVGSQDIQLTVQDSDPDHPRSASQIVRLVVGANSAPVISALTPDKIRVLPGEVIGVQAAVSDPEGRVLEFVWSCTAGAIMSGQGTGQITWKAPQDAGDSKISLTVSDGLRQAQREVTIRVSTLTVDAGENRVILLQDLPITLQGQVNISPANEPYTIAWRIDPNSIPEGASPQLSSPTSLATQFSTNAVGNYHIWLTATAGGEISDQDDLWVKVTDQTPPTVSGYVKDAQGNPISGAAVEMYSANSRQDWDQKTVTDQSGYYEFRDVPSGTYYVVVAREGYWQMTKVITIP